MKIENQPIRSVLESISEVFNGTWQKKGDIYVFSTRTPAPRVERQLTEEEARTLEDAMKKLESELQRDFGDGSAFIKRFRIDEEFAKEHAEMARKLAEQFRKEFPNMFNEEWAREHAAEARKFAEEFRKRFADGKHFVSPGIEFDRKQAEEWAARAKEMAEKFQKEFGSGMTFTHPDPEKLKELMKSLEMHGFPHWIRPGGTNVTALFDSITPDQWKKHEAQGFLTPADLTPEQRKFLGEFQGNFVIGFVINGRRLNIKHGG
jgi:hypothetical protein